MLMTDHLIKMERDPAAGSRIGLVIASSWGSVMLGSFADRNGIQGGTLYKGGYRHGNENVG
jgi:hypothetical protein